MILIIDDHIEVRTALRMLCELQDWTTLEAESPAAAIALLRQDAQQAISLVVQDMNFSLDTTSGMEGQELFAQIRALRADLPIVLLTAWTHLEQAVALVRAGAADYLQKPWDDVRLLTIMRNLLELSEQRRLAYAAQQQLRAHTQELSHIERCGTVVKSAAMLDLIRLSARIANSDLPALITGPNGAGKEHIAAIVHANSRVRGGPMISVNCGAIPAELIESELFGAEAGAYTGAHKARIGKIEAADGGTLFLDEIANLPLAGQMKLLRVLESKQFERLGSGKSRSVSLRVLSATNADLRAEIAAGRFREDLYYRLNGIELRVPPLAERRDDILPLAEHFLRIDSSKADSTKAAAKRLSADAQAALLNHSWPGNVRELRNSIQRAALLASDVLISAADLMLPKASPPKVQDDDEHSREDIVRALETSAGVVSDAAHALGLTRQSLYRRMQRFGIVR